MCHLNPLCNCSVRLPILMISAQSTANEIVTLVKADLLSKHAGQDWNVRQQREEIMSGQFACDPITPALQQITNVHDRTFSNNRYPMWMGTGRCTVPGCG